MNASDGGALQEIHRSVLTSFPLSNTSVLIDIKEKYLQLFDHLLHAIVRTPSALKHLPHHSCQY
jgi:hypothetical protein